MRVGINGMGRIGGSDTANLIRFRGTPGEGPGAYTNTVIGEYRYDTTGLGERSELLLFKANDVGRVGRWLACSVS